MVFSDPEDNTDSRLLKCADCGKEISKRANSCPHCGAPNESASLTKSQTKSNQTNHPQTNQNIGCLHIVGILIVLFFVVIPWFSGNPKKQNTHRANAPSLSAKSNIKVEGVGIQKRHSNAWGVVGSIRNLGSTPIKGTVKIKSLNSNGDILKTYFAYVNDGDPINAGQSGPFEYFSDPSDFNDAVDFQVIFSER